MSSDQITTSPTVPDQRQTDQGNSNDRFRPIIQSLLEHADAGRSWRTTPAAVPATNYTDPAHLALEREALFAARPQMVALSSDLPSPGSYLTRDLFALPLLLTRDSEGAVQAFANVCAHRGAQVAPDGRGSQRRFACPYHAWTYDLAGTLVGVPDSESFPEVCVPGEGLRPLTVLEENGLIWVRPDLGNQHPIDPELGAFGAEIDSLDVSGHNYWRSHRFELALNWKLVIDTFLEPYHFGSLHRNTVGPLFISNLCHAERSGAHVREMLPRRTIDVLRDEPTDSWDVVPHCAIVYVLFPNTVFVMLMDHIETWRVVPDPVDPSRSVCDLDFYIPDAPQTESSQRHWESNWKLTIDTVINEDFAAMAGVQRGLASGAIDQLRIGANEPAMNYFHASLADALPAH